ncbi:iron-regulated protein, partial [Candidatus Gracilibacteria bacterium]|nr:iron-regulated protein [Candidatus Gracilibacteria bacterium]
GENAERRGQYLSLASALLVEHLAGLVAEWAPEQSDNYRASFLALPPSEAIQKVLTGMGVLSKAELAGERMFTAYDNQDQEDEHSCFSDNTHRDIITNFQGIRNVYLGSYTRLDGSTLSGTGLDAVVQAVDAELATQMRQQLDTALTQTNAIAVPFDRAIVGADTRPQVLDTVYTLQDIGDSTASIGTALGLTINTALPE